MTDPPPDQHHTPAASQPDDALETFGRNLRAARLARDMTLAQLADLSGVSIGYISDIERCLANPTFDVMFNVAAAVGSDISALLGPAGKLRSG